jgi:hypothetical protein
VWKYSQSTGELTSPSGIILGIGYSGHGEGLNNPAKQDEHNVGPIPQGQWSIGEFFDDLGGKGPVVAHLAPGDGTATFGRSGFMIHGDNKQVNHTASHGCVILGRTIRQIISASGVRSLEVAA